MNALYEPSFDRSSFCCHNSKYPTSLFTILEPQNEERD